MDSKTERREVIKLLARLSGHNSVAQFADAARVSRATLNWIVTGKHAPSVKTLRRLATYVASRDEQLDAEALYRMLWQRLAPLIPANEESEPTRKKYIEVT